MRKKQTEKAAKISIWGRLGLHLGGGGRDFRRDLEPLGASWVVFGRFFFVLVFGMVFQSGLGGFGAGFWVDFGGVGEDLGRALGGVWEGFSRILGGSGLFWAILRYSGILELF